MGTREEEREERAEGETSLLLLEADGAAGYLRTCCLLGKPLSGQGAWCFVATSRAGDWLAWQSSTDLENR